MALKRSYIKRKAKPKKRQKSELALFKKKLWKKFADFVKKRDGNTCFSCGKTPLIGNDWHAAHCFSAGKYPALRWRLDNVFSGCAKCNIFLKGNYVEFHARYKERFGQEKYDELFSRRNNVKQWRLEDLKEVERMIDGNDQVQVVR